MFTVGSADLAVHAVAVAATVNDLNHVVHKAATDAPGVDVDRLGREVDRSSEAAGVDRHTAPCRVSGTA